MMIIYGYDDDNGAQSRETLPAGNNSAILGTTGVIRLREEKYTSFRSTICPPGNVIIVSMLIAAML